MFSCKKFDFFRSGKTESSFDFIKNQSQTQRLVLFDSSESFFPFLVRVIFSHLVVHQMRLESVLDVFSDFEFELSWI